MTRSLAQIFKEADEVIEKYASVEPATVSDEEDIFKLAAAVRASVPGPSPEPGPLALTEMEKVAMAIAIVETAMSAPELIAFSEFEKKAKESGYNDSQVTEFFSKVAEKNPAGRRAIELLAATTKYLDDYCNS